MLVTKERVDKYIDREDVIRYLGYRAGHKVPARVSTLIDRHIQDASWLIEPQCSYVIKDVERVEGTRVFLEDVIFESRVIAQLMQRCQKAAIFAVTIGGLLELKVKRLVEKRQVLEAAIVDAIGSDAADKLAETIHSQIGEIASAQGLNVSLRFSPGYCDWDIAQQKMVFQAMNGHSLGIRLTDSCLMVPRKSVSGIIGMSSCNGELEKWNPCKTCDQSDCPGRR